MCKGRIRSWTPSAGAIAAAAAPTSIPGGSREAGIAMQVSVDSEDEDDWGHFSFEDGDAPPSSLENYRWN